VCPSSHQPPARRPESFVNALPRWNTFGDISFVSLTSLDRTTTIGQMIDAYLKGSNDLDDHVIHLLFSANRWEAVYDIIHFS
jgi:thymidylate kinase